MTVEQNQIYQWAGIANNPGEHDDRPVQVIKEEVERSGSESALKIDPTGLTDRLDLGCEREESTLAPKFVVRTIRWIYQDREDWKFEKIKSWVLNILDLPCFLSTPKLVSPLV